MDEIIIEDVMENEEENIDENGNIKISVDVVATIAGIAANEIEGVAGMCTGIAGGIAELLSNKKNPSKGVKVEMNGNTVIIDLYIVACYGIRIPELAWEIQENVKNSVESMTGLTVEKVNIHVDGVSFDDEKKEKKEKKSKKEKDDDTIVIDELEDLPEEGSEDL